MPETVQTVPKRAKRPTVRQQRYIDEVIKDDNHTRAYEAAGYSMNMGRVALASAIYRLHHNPTIQLALAKAHREHVDRREALADWALDAIVSEHQRLMELCEARGDYGNATRNLECIGRTRGVYRDGVTVDVRRAQQLTQTEQIEARRLATLLLADGGLVVDVSAEPVVCLPGPSTGPLVDARAEGAALMADSAGAASATPSPAGEDQALGEHEAGPENCRERPLDPQRGRGYDVE